MNPEHRHDRPGDTRRASRLAARHHQVFGDTTVVDDLDLDIAAGEFFSLLGPSGCGKTTTLRMIGGFVDPTAGTVLLDGKDVTGLPPNRRDVNTVFQSYALFDHLSVRDNVAFGLRRKGVDKAEIDRRVGEMLELVQLTGRDKDRPRRCPAASGSASRSPARWSTGPVLLLDEPLAALDLKLRKAMQVELKRSSARSASPSSSSPTTRTRR